MTDEQTPTPANPEPLAPREPATAPTADATAAAPPVNGTSDAATPPAPVTTDPAATTETAVPTTPAPTTDAPSTAPDASPASAGAASAGATSADSASADSATASTSGAPLAPKNGIAPVTGEWVRVSPKYLTVDLISTIVWGIIMTVAVGIPWALTQLSGLIALPIVMFVIFLIATILTPRRVRAIAYQLRDDDLVFRRGILFQRFVAVPYGRMQLVDVTRGPLARAVGLSELKLVTAAAASNIDIPGLPAETAEQLRDHLVDLAESRRAGL
ncbi:MAG: PH domain-containing protein [Microbacteriaceae bacterium]